MISLDDIPRLGWVSDPSPVIELPALAERLTVPRLWVKRDDALATGHGGSKVRKLDYLLAEPRYADAPTWVSAGAIGSGHLVALTRAAVDLGKRLRCHMHWEPVAGWVLNNLAYVASGPTEIIYHARRVSMALRAPHIWNGRHAHVIPLGATSPRAAIGMVRGALELCAQLGDQMPARIYVPWGTGATAAGLAVGLGLAGAPTVVHAIAVVERTLSPRWRVRRLVRALRDELARHGVRTPHPARIVIDRTELGWSYGVGSNASRSAVSAMEEEGLHLEPIYSGKAMAALMADAQRGHGESVLLWLTPHRGPLPHHPDWAQRLPQALARRLWSPGRARSRRTFVMGGLGLVLTAGVWGRLSGYQPLPGWEGLCLAPWQGHVVGAAAEALLPHATMGELADTARAVDSYLSNMTADARREVHAMFATIEHATTPLALQRARFTQLASRERLAFLERLQSWGGLLAQAARGLRDLVYLGYYQQASSWPALAYGGPTISSGRSQWPQYESLRAPPRSVPVGWRS